MPQTLMQHVDAEQVGDWIATRLHGDEEAQVVFAAEVGEFLELWILTRPMPLRDTLRYYDLLPALYEEFVNDVIFRINVINPAELAEGADPFGDVPMEDAFQFNLWPDES